MEENKQPSNEPLQADQTGEALAPDQAADVAGGGDCIAVGPISLPGSSLTEAYDGVVDAASHVIERVVNSF